MRPFRLRRASLKLCLAAALAASIQCGGGESTKPPSVSTIVLNGGNNQTAAVGASVSTAPSVRVTDAGGNAVAGVSVTFVVSAGGGSVAGGTQSTNSSGVATVGSWTMGTALGVNSLVATAGGTTGGPITFSATATAGPASIIAINGGNSQTAVAGNAVATAPSVKVTDIGGNPVTATTVTFAVVSGGGSLTAGAQVTNSSGIATVGSWTLAATGANTLSATVPGLTGSPVTFTATGTVGPAAKLGITSTALTTAQNRVAFTTQPVVQVQDASANPVAQAGTVVTVAIASGGGTLGGTATATTNASGAATFVGLSIAGTVGARTLTFTATGLSTAQTSITTTAGAAASIAVNANNNQTTTVGTALTVSPSVKVSDADANGVQGVSVTFAVASGGGSGTGLAQTTSASGVAAPGNWTLGATPGTNTMTALSTGLTGSPVTLTATGVASTVTVTSVSPSVLIPGISATITGTAFNTTPAQNTVTIDGVPTTVTAATLTQLTVTVPTTLPCEATHDATVSVTVTGNPAVTITKPLQVATLRSLAVGQSVVVTSASEIRCNELSNTGTSRYFISVFNTNPTFSTSPAAFTIRGVAATGVGASLRSRIDDRDLLAADASRDAARRRAALRPRSVDDGDRLHLKVLEQNIRNLNDRRTELAQVARRGASRNVTAAVPVVGDPMSLRLPNVNSASICTNAFDVTGRVAYVGTRSIIVEDMANQLAGQIDTTYAQIGQEFDQIMYPILETNFGNPLALDASTDNNQRIIMVFSRKVNDSLPGLAGFVVSCDFTARNTTTNTQSNFGEYFYAKAPTVAGSLLSTTNSPPNWRWTMRGTIIHEVKHITSFAERISRAGTFETSWLEESTARISEELYERSVYAFAQKANIGYGSASNPVGPYCGVRGCGGKARGIVRVFEELGQKWYAAPEDYSPLGRINANDFSFYATGWSLVRWAIDHTTTTTESAFLKGLVQQASASGLANLEARAGRSFADMLPEWTFSMVLDDYPAFTPAVARLTQPSWNFRNVFAGYDADFASWTPAAWPLLPYVRSFGAFALLSDVMPGTAAFIELSGTQTAKQLIELKATGSPLGAPAELRIAIVRVQ